MADQNTIILVMAIGIFVAFLLSLILLASLLRQFRFFRWEQAQLVVTVTADPVVMAPPVDEWVVLRNAVPLPEFVSAPINNTASDAVVLMIEPLDGPTRDQRNIQKLISFLRQESLQPEIAPKAS
ncbi:MAG TPA: hypothetical protein VHO69_13600 [Phototrophicaceae bacterium]|nr:hypothetical protein [Phototrophicaceae bacterium]